MKGLTSSATQQSMAARGSSCTPVVRLEHGQLCTRTCLSASVATTLTARSLCYTKQKLSRGNQIVYSMQSGRTSQPPESTAALVRRPSPVPVPQEVFVDMTQVVGKQVITRTTGRDLGIVSCMWVDPKSGEVVSLDLDDKKGVGSTRVANIYLSRLTQIGDVVLVHDEQVLYDQPLDGRYGFIILTGMEVRTRNGDFLGKVRDFAFSPDTGALSKIMYDDFGLSFLPVTFFDTFSISMSDVLSIGVNGIVANDEAKYRERKETSGVFAAIPSLLRTLSSGSNRAPAALLGSGDPYRQDAYLPQGYSYDQWESDVRRWEQETGLNYEQYIRAQGSRPTSRQLTATSPRPALPSRSSANTSTQYGGPMQQQQQPMQQNSWQGIGSMQRPQAPMRGQQQQQPAYAAQQQPLQRPMQAQRPGTDPRYRTSPATPSGSPYGNMDGTQQRAMQQPMRPQAQPQQRPPMQQQQQQQQPSPAANPNPAAQPAAAVGRDSSNMETSSSTPSEQGGRRIDDYIARGAGPRVREREVVLEGRAAGEPSGWPDAPRPGANSWGGYYGQQAADAGRQQPPPQQ